MTDAGQHQPVLLQEVLAGFSLRADGVYVDATFGRGGHSRAILSGLGPDGALYAIDRDPAAVASAAAMCADDPRFRIQRGNFADLGDLITDWNIHGRIDGLLLDLGVSSPQLDTAERGFGFLRDGPLDMRMDPDSGRPASAWLAQADEREIADVLWRFGEERQSRRIARAIVHDRVEQPFARTRQLAELIARVAPSRKSADKHPATRSFQAIRIHINAELEALRAVLEQTPDCLAVGGRLAVISFHSLEDRLVKRFIRECENGPSRPRGLPPPSDWRPRLRALGRAIKPSAAELAVNPRSRSAVLRLAERLP